MFNKAKQSTIHFELLNAIARHTGNGDGFVLNHPRAAHNLLGYKIDSLSFSDMTSSGDWIGDSLEPSPRYQLLARYHILNWDVLDDADRRVHQAEAQLTEATQGHQQ